MKTWLKNVTFGQKLTTTIWPILGSKKSNSRQFRCCFGVAHKLFRHCLWTQKARSLVYFHLERLRSNLKTWGFCSTFGLSDSNFCSFSGQKSNCLAFSEFFCSHVGSVWELFWGRMMTIGPIFSCEGK